MAEVSYPDDLLYHPEHDWARIDPCRPRRRDARHHLVRPGRARRGRVLRPAPPGTIVHKDEPYAEVESVKAVSDVVAPLSGEIVEVNEALAESPNAINEDPYGEGWLVKVRMSDPTEREALLDADAYSATLGADGAVAPAARLTTLDPYTSVTDSDLAAMLAAIGVSSVQEIFDRQIPEACASAARSTARTARASRRSTSTCARSPPAT